MYTCIFLCAVVRLAAFEVGDSFGQLIKNYSFDEMTAAPEYNLQKFSDDGISVKILQSSRFGGRELSDFILHTSGFLTAYQNKTKLGTFAFVEYGDGENLRFYYDYDGDGIIDAESSEYFIPAWVLFRANIRRKKPEQLINLCRTIYDEFNSSTALNEENIEACNLKISEIFKSETCECYDVYYAYLVYLTQIDQPYAYKILKSLNNFLRIKFKMSAMPLFTLYIAESYFTLQQYDIARAQFRVLKNADMQSIIADFYIAYINDLRTGTDTERRLFAEKFPQMWILNRVDGEIVGKR